MQTHDRNHSIRYEHVEHVYHAFCHPRGKIQHYYFKGLCIIFIFALHLIQQSAFMKHTTIIIILIVAFRLSAITQPAQAVKGTVMTAGQKPVSHATVSLLYSKDSSIVTSALTDTTGKFTLQPAAPGIFLLSVTSVGYRKYISNPLEVSNTQGTLLLPEIGLTREDDKGLKEVTVVARRSLVEQGLDRTIINVDAMLTAASSNTMEVLEKTPGVTVDNNGEISLNGKAGVLVLIDGRPTYLSGPNLAAYLKSIPGGSLDKIELMSNPPARYDAAGNAIINIKLKKNRFKGLTGNLSLGYNQGSKLRSNDALNINYHTKKINLSGNFSYARDAGYSADVYQRKLYDSNQALLSSVMLKNNSNNYSDAYNFRTCIDYSISSKTTLGAILYVNRRSGNERLDYTNSSFDAFHNPDSTGNGYNLGSSNWTNTGANLNFLHRFNDKGKELSADMNYIDYQTQAGISSLSDMRLPDQTLAGSKSFYYDLPSSIRIYNAQIDYSHPLPKDARLEIGIKSGMVKNNSASTYFLNTENGTKQDDSQSNHFLYRESIHAVYVNARKQFKRWGIQAGLRVENTQINGHQLGNSIVPESIFKRDFTGLFPSMFLNYKLDSAGSNTVALNLSRRINRPNYQQLNPFLLYRDQYSYTSGNPGLKPQYSYMFELNYRHKQLLGISFQYGQFSDIVFQTTKAEKEVFITRPENIASGKLIALANNLSLSPAGWWTSNLNIVFVRLALDGMAYTEKLTPTMYTGRVNMLNQFRFGKNWSAELIAMYYHRDLAGQTIIKPRFRMQAALQKLVLKNRGSIRLSMEDIFHTWKQNDETISLQQATSVHTGITDTRRFGIAFTWRLGNQGDERKRDYKEKAAEEKARVDQ